MTYIHIYSLVWAPNPIYSTWKANYIPLVLLGVANIRGTIFQSWACYQLATSSGQVFLINFKMLFKFVVLLNISKVQLFVTLENTRWPKKKCSWHYTFHSYLSLYSYSSITIFQLLKQSSFSFFIFILFACFHIYCPLLILVNLVTLFLILSQIYICSAMPMSLTCFLFSYLPFVDEFICEYI